MANKVHLLVIDPQEDFVNPTTGSLYVPGAEHDMARLASMVEKSKDLFDDIHVTLDSHHRVHIAHAMFWKDEHGNPPGPFTEIKSNDIESGRFTPVKPSLYRLALNYTRELEKGTRYTLTIWPEHCIIGTPGHNVYGPLREALSLWERDFGIIDFVTKGSNPYTEHYSAFQAAVIDPSDPSTQLNVGLIDILEQVDILGFSGEALTHCVLNTMTDLVDNFNDKSAVRKIVFLKDASSRIVLPPGPDNDALQKKCDDFLVRLKGLGMQEATCQQFVNGA